MNKPEQYKNGRFRQTTYRDGKISESDLNEDQILALDPHEDDLHFNEAFGRICIRKQDGKFIEYFGAIPGVGAKNERFLTEMMWNPGQLITPRQVAPVLKKSKIYEQDGLHNAVAALLSRLRKGLGEDASRPWFILSRRRPFSFGWNPARTWCLIERIAEPTRDEAEGDKQ